VGNLKETAKQTRIAAYKSNLKSLLADDIIDTSLAEFADLKSEHGKPMSSLNGEIILQRDVDANGKLKGVISIHPDILATILPDIKADPIGTGWNKYIANYNAKGKNILNGVADRQANEYEQE